MATGREFECDEDETASIRSAVSGYGATTTTNVNGTGTGRGSMSGVVRRNRAGNGSSNANAHSSGAISLSTSHSMGPPSINGDDRDEVASQTGSIGAPSVISAATTSMVVGTSTAGASGSGTISSIRSRVTVVCAECKRLKLRCDRRTPCGSCLKRDTVQRCLYSPAAAEKIDVQTLHNRLTVVEDEIKRLSHPQPINAASTSTIPLPVAAIAGPSTVIAPGGPSASSSASAVVRIGPAAPPSTQLSITFGSYTTAASPGGVIALCRCSRSSNRTLASPSSGSGVGVNADVGYREGGSVSLAVPIEGSVLGMWMDMVDVRRDGLGVALSDGLCVCGRCAAGDLDEEDEWDMDVDCESVQTEEDEEDMSPMMFYAENRALFHYTPFSGETSSLDSSPSPAPGGTTTRPRKPIRTRLSHHRPMVTPSLLSHLPAPSMQPYIMSSLEQALRVVLYEGASSGGAWGRWRSRVASLNRWSEVERRRVEEREARMREKEKGGVVVDKGKGVDRGSVRSVGGGQTQSERMERPSLAFFAAVAAGMALGLVYWNEDGRRMDQRGVGGGGGHDSTLGRVGLGVLEGEGRSSVSISTSASPINIREGDGRGSEVREEEEEEEGVDEVVGVNGMSGVMSTSSPPAVVDLSMMSVEADKDRDAMPPPPPPTASSVSAISSTPGVTISTASPSLTRHHSSNGASSQRIGEQGTTSIPPTPAPGSASIYASDPSPAHLILLARTALELHLERKGAGIDLDVVHAYMLIVLYLLHVQRGSSRSAYGHGRGHSQRNALRGSRDRDQARGVATVPIALNQDLIRVNAEMVSAAKMMGLGWDPDVVDYFGGNIIRPSVGADGIKREEEPLVRMTLFEKEVRRRMWGAVVCCDLLVAESFNVAPLIIDTEHSTRLPAELEDERFGPSSTTLPTPVGDTAGVGMSYFIQRIRLAQLCKALCLRTRRDHSTAPPTGGEEELSLDAAVACDVEVDAFLKELPEELTLKVTEDVSNALAIPDGSSLGVPSSTTVPSSAVDASMVAHMPDPPHLIAQRCYLFMTANHAVLKRFTPFMKCILPHNVQLAAPQEATLRCMRAAHFIIYASRVLLSLSGQISPAMFLFYPVSQMVFESGVVIAHVLVQQQRSMLSRTAFEDLRAVVDVMHDASMLTGRTQRIGNEEGQPSEAARVMEALLAKARAALSGPSTLSIKRKHDDMDESELFRDGFSLPFAGANVELDDLTKPVSTPMPIRTTVVVNPSTSKPARTGGSHSGSGHTHARSRGHASKSAGSDAGAPTTSGLQKDQDAHTGGKYATSKSKSHSAHNATVPPQYGIRVRSDTNSNSRKGSVASRTSDRQQGAKKQGVVVQREQSQPAMQVPSAQVQHQRQMPQQLATQPQSQTQPQVKPQTQPQTNSQPPPMHSLQPPPSQEAQVHPPMVPPQFGQSSQLPYQVPENTSMQQSQQIPQAVSLTSDMPYGLGNVYAQSQVSTAYGPIYGTQSQQTQPQNQPGAQPTQHRSQPPPQQQIQMHQAQHAGTYGHYSTNTSQASPYSYSTPPQEFDHSSMISMTGTPMIDTSSAAMGMAHSHSMPPTPQEGTFHRRDSIDFSTERSGMIMSNSGPSQHYAPQQQHAQMQPPPPQQQQHQSQQQFQTDWSNQGYPNWDGYRTLL